jgi:hypothetical protein
MSTLHDMLVQAEDYRNPNRPEVTMRMLARRFAEIRTVDHLSDAGQECMAEFCRDFTEYLSHYHRNSGKTLSLGRLKEYLKHRASTAYDSAKEDGIHLMRSPDRRAKDVGAKWAAMRQAFADLVAAEEGLTAAEVIERFENGSNDNGQ